MNSRNQYFTDHSSIVILITLVVVSLLANSFFRPEDKPDTYIEEIRFPAYETESEAANRAMPFTVNVELPDGWQTKNSGSSENYPELRLYSPYYIYSEDVQIGFIAFNVFTLPQDDVDMMSYHQYVWPVMDKGTMEINNYTIIRLTDKFEASFCKISDGNSTADAILCYNKDLKNMAAVVLKEDVADEQKLKNICLSLSFSAQ